ncbi:S-layer family protein [Phormidium sp. CLA17]|uniref:two-partner secretion domain-containing protein n=1 Tax=Leptolyngbya sp. Cla-17 TaxID=2803751 RepID=UPI0014912BC8|nr:S-layer family protein [Leptolyngbya sp. Cla-17]MBM0741693.1 S-layer family protein [Leptolyngbya sp. Cla-17]
MPLRLSHRIALSACIVAATPLTAQPPTYSQSITFDGTLGTTRNLTGPAYQIQQSDGITVGTNLFHSFGRFSLNQGESVVFFSADNIRNILARVTGGSPSLINGEIFTDSFAVNLFLINPKGIIFGPDASLDIGGATRGSFIATTVDAITFPGGHQFSATNPGNRQSLLNLVGDPSGFLASQRTPAPIQVIGSNLDVYLDQRLLLLGGNVTLDNASLIANGGSIQLGSVTGAGIIDLSISDTQLNLQFPSSLPRGDIKIANGSKIDTGAFGSNGGDILIEAGSLSVTDGSDIFSGAIGSAKGGNILINVQGVTRFDGTDTNGDPTAAITSVLLGDSTSRAGDLQINTGTLLVTNGALLSTSPVLGQGGSGNIIINAQDSVIFDGEGSKNQSRAVSSLVLAEGQGGDIQITTGSLFVRNGADLVTSTVGIGNAGDIVINARDTVVFDGIGNPNSGRISSASSSVEQGSSGNGGDIRIATGSLFITNGAGLNSSSAGIGDAGAITIDARDQVVVDGASVISPSGIASFLLLGEGKGGDISIATGSFTASGGLVSSGNLLGKGDSGNIAISARDNVTIRAGGVVSTQTFGEGDAGSLRILAGKSVLLDSGKVSADSNSVQDTVIFEERRSGLSLQQFGLPQTQLDLLALLPPRSGRAGNIEIATPLMQMDRGSQIVSTTTSGDGGNIILNIHDLLLMRRGSKISTTAGTFDLGGNGGNITINTPKGFIVGVKGENSDISANAFTGSGGRVNITAQGIYGLQFRPKSTEFSDITASSTFGVSGVVAINTLGIDPSRGLQPLPVSLVDPSNRIDQKCAAGSGFQRSSFTVTGRGGLPENPFDPLQSGEGVASWVEVKAEGNGQRAEGAREGGEARGGSREGKDPIIEANGWVVDKGGSIFLVANGSMVEDQGSWQGLPTCLLDQ